MMAAGDLVRPVRENEFVWILPLYMAPEKIVALSITKAQSCNRHKHTTLQGNVAINRGTP
jgi:hypothetical protein